MTDVVQLFFITFSNAVRYWSWWSAFSFNSLILISYGRVDNFCCNDFILLIAVSHLWMILLLSASVSPTHWSFMTNMGIKVVEELYIIDYWFKIPSSRIDIFLSMSVWLVAPCTVSWIFVSNWFIDYSKLFCWARSPCK